MGPCRTSEYAIDIELGARLVDYANYCTIGRLAER
jgi:hypothetical protein